MVVSFTSRLGLAKPDDSELASNLVNGDALYSENNNTIKVQTYKSVTSYSPSLIAHSSNPSMGTGFSQGEYQDWMGWIMGCFTLEFFDSGISAGSGEYGISLPFEVDDNYHTVGTALNNTPGTFSVIGEAYFLDNSSVGASGAGCLDVVTIGSTSYARILTQLHTTPVKTSRVFSNGMPFTVANNDKITGSFFYKKA